MVICYSHNVHSTATKKNMVATSWRSYENCRIKSAYNKNDHKERTKEIQKASKLSHMKKTYEFYNMFNDYEHCPRFRDNCHYSGNVGGKA